jgi:hypothetical protein
VQFGQKAVDNKSDVLRWFDSKHSRAKVLSDTVLVRSCARVLGFVRRWNKQRCRSLKMETNASGLSSRRSLSQYTN